MKIQNYVYVGLRSFVRMKIYFYDLIAVFIDFMYDLGVYMYY